MYRFGVIGKDRRMKYMCEYLCSLGYDAVMCEENYCGRTALILPANEWYNEKYDGFTVFGKGGKYDYTQNGFFKSENAYPTAEGALLIAMQNTDKVLKECKSVITGSGNIASCLYGMMNSLGMPVKMCARRSAEQKITDIPMLCPDIIFNTVPAQILTEDILSRLPPSCIIIELASAPYGVNADTARRHGITVIPAGGLPGRFFPRTAGRILAETVLLMAEVE